MRRRAASLGLILLATASCLEPPVSESLEVEMRPGGAARVSVAVGLRDPADFVQVPAVRRRLEDEGRAFELGTDAWSERLRGIEPTHERVTFHREKGAVRRIERQVELDDPADLGAFLRDTGISVAYAEGDGWAELTLVPGSGRRATSAQRQLVRGELARFSEAAAAYIQASADLYAYLAGLPDRARACLGAIVSEIPEGDELTPDEEILVGALNDAIASVGAVLEIAPGEALTFDEVSLLVHDPFPARTTVSVPGKILERDGFPGGVDAPLAIPRLSVWSAYTRLSERWLAPDLALELWKHDLEAGGRPIDLDRLAALPRRVRSVPSPEEVRRAVERDLSPAPAYRVRWEP